MTAPGRIPLTVVGGFLGAGKTTLVNHLLREIAAPGEDRRVAVLVNDFGAVNVDAALIASRSADTMALSNGCVCCQIGDDFMAALIRVLETTPPFDAIVVEASGVADPWRIGQVAQADPALSLEAVLVLVDAEAVLAQWRDPRLADTLARQLAAADLVLLNKVDRVGADEKAEVLAWLAGVLGPVRVLETTQARVPAGLLTGDLRRAGERSWTLRPLRGTDHGAAFESCVLRPAAALSAPALRALLRAMPAGVLRLKGLVVTVEGGWMELQFSGRHGSLRPARAAPDDGLPVLVAIGLAGALPRSALEQALAAAAVP